MAQHTITVNIGSNEAGQQFRQRIEAGARKRNVKPSPYIRDAIIEKLKRDRIPEKVSNK